MQAVLKHLIDFILAALVLCILVGVAGFVFGVVKNAAFSPSAEVSSGLPQPASSPSGE